MKNPFLFLYDYWENNYITAKEIIQFRLVKVFSFLALTQEYFNTSYYIDKHVFQRHVGK